MCVEYLQLYDDDDDGRVKIGMVMVLVVLFYCCILEGGRTVCDKERIVQVMETDCSM